VRERLAAASVIPAKRGTAMWQVKVTGPRCGRPSHVNCTEGGRLLRVSSQRGNASSRREHQTEVSKCSEYKHCSGGAGLQPVAAQILPGLKHRIGLIA
jgi:hypothetical protein